MTVCIATCHIREMATGAIEHGKRLLKTAAARGPIRVHTQMPFTRHIGVITSRFKNLSHCINSLTEVPLVTWLTHLIVCHCLRHITKTSNMAIHTRHQH